MSYVISQSQHFNIGEYNNFHIVHDKMKDAVDNMKYRDGFS